MRYIHLSFFLFVLLLNVHASKKYFVVLSEPLSLSSVSGYTTLSNDDQTINPQIQLTQSVFSMPAVEGIKLLYVFENNALSIQNKLLKSENKLNSSSSSSKNEYIYIIKLDENEVDDFLEQVQKLDAFIYYEPNRIFQINSLPTTEPSYSSDQQADFELMNINHVWQHSDGTGMRIAVLDTGIVPNHQEFCDGTAIVDEDNQVMDVSSCSALDAPFDFVYDGVPQLIEGRFPVEGGDYEDTDSAPYDKQGHGSHVSGIVGARVNDRGMAGTAYNSVIIPIRVLAPYKKYINGELTTTGEGTTEWIFNGIMYAVTNNADIINMSLGASYANDASGEQILTRAVDSATEQGILVVAAAGNSSINLDTNKIGPAFLENVLSVAAVDDQGVVAYYSNFGETLDVAAVGGSASSCVYSVSYTSSTSYIRLCGTSMATPYVAGFAGLIKSYYENELNQTLSVSELRRIIQLSASNPTNRSLSLGYGIINAQNAFQIAGAVDSATDQATFYTADSSDNLMCFPNPFYRGTSSSTACSFYLNKAATGQYWIYSRRGQRVSYGQQSYTTGKSSIVWNGVDESGQTLPNGVYQLILKITPTDGSNVITKKHLISLLR